MYEDMRGKDFSSKAIDKELKPTEVFKHLDESLNDTMDPP